MASSGLKHLVLVGLGMAHAQVLKAFAAKRSVSLKITVVNPSSTLVHLDQVPGFVAGQFEATHCSASLDGLLHRCGANLVKAQVIALDAATQQLTLSNGTVLTGDVISVATEAQVDRGWLHTEMPGATEHALHLHPLDVFCSLWPQVAQLAVTRPLNVAVVGEHMTAVELALAVQRALATQPGGQPCRVTLVTGGEPPASNCPHRIQQQVLRKLKQHHITVLRDRCIGMNGHELLLGGGARLVCDAPLLALARRVPSWMGNSGLALSETGQVQAHANGQSQSHPRVYLTCAPQADSDPRIGKRLAAALRAACEDSSPPSLPKTLFTRPYLCFFGGHQALMVLPTPWGVRSLQGTWLLRWKKRWDTARLKACIE